MYIQWAEASHSITSKFFLVAKAGDELWLFLNFWISKGKKKSSFIVQEFYLVHRIASGPSISTHCGSAASWNSQHLHVSIYQIPTGIRAASYVGFCTNCCWLLFCIIPFSVPLHNLTAVQSLVFVDFIFLLNVSWLGTCLVNDLSYLSLVIPVTHLHRGL